jgi:hypothetical protein
MLTTFSVTEIILVPKGCIGIPVHVGCDDSRYQQSQISSTVLGACPAVLSGRWSYKAHVHSINHFTTACWTRDVPQCHCALKHAAVSVDLGTATSLASNIHNYSVISVVFLFREVNIFLPFIFPASKEITAPEEKSSGSSYQRATPITGRQFVREEGGVGQYRKGWFFLRSSFSFLSF